MSAKTGMCIGMGLLAAVCGILCHPLCTAESASKTREPIYDESGNGEKLLADALAAAKQDHKNVLVQFGGNWCGWCYKLHDTLKNDKDLSELLRAEYVLTLIDTRSNEALTKRLAPELRGVPYLTVLDADGKVIKTQATDPFEIDGNAHDPQKVLAFLKEFKPKSPTAQSVLDQAFAQANQQDKKVFLRFGAPWCGWCRRLDAFLARPDMAAIFAVDYVSVKVDTQRMDGGEAAYQQYCKKPAGIPWFAILDRDGKMVAASDSGADGNIGYPAQDPEIAHFMTMLRSTARATTPDQLTAVEKALKTAAQEIKSSRPAGT